MRVKRVPKLRLHKASGQAFVELNGHRKYIGQWSHPDRDVRYHALLTEWERAGRQYPFELPPDPPTPVDETTVAAVLVAYFAHCQTYYVGRDGQPTKQIARIKSALKGVHGRYASLPAAQFGPRKLHEVRQGWVDKGLSRSTINAMTSIVKQCFKWAGSQELIPASIYHGLQTLDGLRMGRSGAKEPEPVRPVLEAHVDAVEPFVSRQVWAMIRLQLLCACRSGEIVALRNDGSIDRSGKVWQVTLERHKNAYRGHQRTLFFGPEAQAILRPWLMERPIGAYLFDPREAEAERYAKAAVHRRPDQAANPRKTSRKVADHYSVLAYCQAIRRACVKAKVPTWSPGQLRHTAATKIRAAAGLEMAQIALGHSRADVTQVYAEANTSRAIALFEKLG